MRVRTPLAALCAGCLLHLACAGEDEVRATPPPSPPGPDAGAEAAAVDAGAEAAADAGCVQRWVPHGTGPVLGFTRTAPTPPTFDLYNDPSLIEEDGRFRMWMSNHDTALPPEYCCLDGTAEACVSPMPVGMTPRFRVRAYEASSPDGKAWTVITPARLSPDPGSWDGARVETPVVVRVGTRYHMYYTGNGDCEPEGRYAIGHAWSDDGGESWTKDPANPIVTMDPSLEAWGGIGVAEPAILHRGGTFWLYYAAARCRAPGCSGPDPKAARAVMLRTSTDGSTFGAPQVALTDPPGYPASAGYEGPSTPMVREDAQGTVHLYYDIFRIGPPRNRQVALAHATSANGLTFEEVETDLLTTASAPWLAWEVRAPYVLEHAGKQMMWFAGNNGADPSATGFTIGIGLATLETVCEP